VERQLRVGEVPQSEFASRTTHNERLGVSSDDLPSLEVGVGSHRNTLPLANAKESVRLSEEAATTALPTISSGSAELDLPSITRVSPLGLTNVVTPTSRYRLGSGMSPRSKMILPSSTSTTARPTRNATSVMARIVREPSTRQASVTSAWRS
jgi:hypothetical protein